MSNKDKQFLGQQIDHAEAKKLGRDEYYCDIDTDGSFHSGYRRADAATKPPLGSMNSLSYGTKRGVAKP